MFARFFVAVISLALASSANAQREECSIAVLNLQSVGLGDSNKHVPVLLTDTMATVASETTEGRCSVVTQADIAQMLDFEAQKAACGGDAVSCMSEIGGALGVRYVIGGSVGKLGSTYTLQARYIDIQSAKVIRRREVDITGDIAQLRSAAKDMARDLIDDKGEVEEAPPPVDKEPASAGGPNGTFLWSGVGLAALGATAAVVGGAVAAGADQTLGSPSSSTADKNKALSDGPVFFTVGVVGAALLAGGGALIGLSFME